MGLYFHKAVCKFISRTFSFDDKRGWGSCIEMESYQALSHSKHLQQVIHLSRWGIHWVH